MASCLASHTFTLKPFPECKSIQRLRVKANAFRDEGRGSDIVDANLNVLKERIEAVKMKERLEKCCRRYEHGWNYKHYSSVNVDKKKRQDREFWSEFSEIVGLVGGTVGFTCLSGTLFLCLLSLLFSLYSSIN